VSWHLHIDPFAGIAGDMFLGALIDLGAPLDAIDAALEPLGIEPAYQLTAEPTLRQGIKGTDFKVQITNHKSQTTEHPHVHPPAILAMVDQLDTTDRARQRAAGVVNRLAEAEAAVHDMPVEKVHFHEVGAVDSIIDMLGSAIALELLDIDTISCASLPMGHGFVKCAHGMMPLPAPATANLLRDIPQHGVDRECETVTPTGAAIVAALSNTFGTMPAMQVEAVGYGAGDRDDPDVPNLLRAYMGTLIT
jgi:uncharacterized protein (TIGR00299 family) protein